MTAENEFYRDFTEDDFIVDPRFQEWILNPSEASDQFWHNLQLQFPAKSEAIAKARQLLNQLKFKEKFPSDGLVREKYLEYKKRIEALNEEVDRNTGDHQIDLRIIRRRNKRWPAALKVAAVATGLTLISYLILQLTNTATTQSWSTAYGEHQTIYLPDSTMVVLNSKSVVRINKWKNDQPREVWLEGEAYFDVKHLERKGGDSGRIPFRVYTNQVQIDVLGTAFDVRERRGLTEVVLQRGLINLRIDSKLLPGNNGTGQQSGSNGPATINRLMYPGDRVIYDPTISRIASSRIDVGDYLKWREKKLLLIDPTAGEICRYLEDNFGKKILFEDSALQYKKIEGPILITNLDDALFVISTVLNTRISKSDSVIIFKNK